MVLNLNPSLNVNIDTNGLATFLQGVFQTRSVIPRDEFNANLASFLSLKGANVTSQDIIAFLAKSGYIEISDSMVHSKRAITYQSFSGFGFTINGNTVSQTDKSTIAVGQGASIKGTGNAKIEQREDGSIVFSL